MTFSTCNGWRRLSLIFLSSSILLLTACGLTGPFPGVPDFVSASSIPVYTGPVAAPQVAYRIDENRYFEIVPTNKYACMYADLFYVDTGRGIRSYIYPWREGYNMDADFIIDAANDQYLVAPVDAGSGNCSSGGGTCPGPALLYSIDSGRGWRRLETYSPSDAIFITGSMAYTSPDLERARMSDLSKLPNTLRDWKPLKRKDIPLPEGRPAEARFHCKSNEKG